MVYKLEEKYMWRAGNYPVSADDAHKEIDRIGKKCGEITAQSVLDQSRPKTSVLHDCFEWDDGVASEKWRLYQSSALLGNLVKVAYKHEEGEEPEELTVRAYVNTEPNRFAGKGTFVSINTALTNTVMYRTVIRNALKELKAFRAKYATIEALGEVFAAIDDAIDRIEKEGT